MIVMIVSLIRNRSLNNMIFNKLKYLVVFTISILFLAQTFSLAEGDEKNKSRLNKITDQVTRTFLDINSISTQFYNNGISDIDPTGNSGFVFPKGSGKTAVFTSGLLWGGMVEGDPVPRVGGTAYRTGLQPGVILPNGQADDPDLDKYRIYRARPDVYPGGSSVDLSGDAANELISESELLAMYLLDWTEWPAELGAPYYDGNGNGVYDAVPDPNPELRDIPGFPGADQTVWFVANDMDAAKTNNLYGAQPIGIEVQATFWAYSQTGALGNTYFRKYRLINKGFQENTVNDMYFSMWSDVDLGGAGDDFVGVDTVLSLQYSYNASATDQTYNPLPPPSVGFDFFQGPLVDGVAGEDKNRNGIDDALDFGIFDGKNVGPGLINLPMTAAYYFANGDPNIGDPPQGDIQGSTEFYNFFRGRFGISGQPFIDFSTGQVTTYALNGDPLTNSGWLDGIQLPPGDRRQGSASGPFTLAPGDTQEVVVAEIVAGAIPGVDRIAAIGLLKFYDAQAQIAYDNFFDLPVAPPAPIVTTTELEGKIVLDWSKDNDRVILTETFDAKGYKFQGYNIYQLPSAFSTVTEGVRVATYDVIDGIGKINDFVFDPVTGSVVTVPVQFGNDTGIKRFLTTRTDAINQRPLINGIKYYFAVTAYNYNPDPNAVPNNLETPIAIITVIPHKNNPGVTYGEDTGSDVEVVHEGTADGGPTITIVDPAATTGHDYEVIFTEEPQIRDANGDWIPASIVLRKTRIMDPDTLTGSSVDISAIYSPTAGVIELTCFFNYVTPDGNWCEGIEMDFPAGMTIIEAPTFDAGGGTIVPEVVGNHINMGDVSGALTGDGWFHGGETWTIFVATFEPPQGIDWEIWDDGWSGGAVNAVGTTTLTDIGFASRLADHWNLRDVTKGEVKLEKMTLINGIDQYPPRDDSPTELGPDADPIVDGFQIHMNVVYGAPVDFTTLTVEGDGSYDIDSYFANGWAATAKAIDAWGAGTTDLAELQKDYEIRYTGVYEDPTASVVYVQEGTGSIATLEGARGYDLADHPMNPNPGSSDPFTVRIPFEVWSIDDDKQINILVYDREGDPTAPDQFYAFNPAGRVYCHFLPTDYHETVVDINGPEVDNLTWNTVWWEADWVNGDILTFQYDNPIVKGSDRWTFTTTESAFSSTLAGNQVGDINVFPNPYYGTNSEELNKYNRFVTFTHLPEKAKIRIFNLAGVLVKTIDKNDPDQFTRWDLNNESNLPVASGLYIAHIELPDLGTSKVLKVAIIQEEQILDRF